MKLTFDFLHANSTLYKKKPNENMYSIKRLGEFRKNMILYRNIEY